MHCKDWLYFRLTGVRATDPTEGLFSFGDFRTRTYSAAVLDALGLADLERLLPPMVDGAAHADALSPAAARATDWRRGSRCRSGSVDVMCSAIGAGLHDPAARPGLTILGSTGMHMRFRARRAGRGAEPGPKRLHHAISRRGVRPDADNMAATLNIDWVLGVAAQFLGNLGTAPRCRGSARRAGRAGAGGAPGSGDVSPLCLRGRGERSGSRSRMRARASPGSTRASGGSTWCGACTTGSRSPHGTATRHGADPREIRLTGGAARSAALRKLIAAALRAPVRTVAQPEAGAAGAAMIAGVAQGLFADISAATDAWVAPLLEAPEAPDEGLAAVSDALFESYVATRRALGPAWTAQAAMRGAIG